MSTKKDPLEMSNEELIREPWVQDVLEEVLDVPIRAADGTITGGIMGTRQEQVPHDHTEYVEGCFRCDLSREEAKETWHEKMLRLIDESEEPFHVVGKVNLFVQRSASDPMGIYYFFKDPETGKWICVECDGFRYTDHCKHVDDLKGI